MLSKSRNLRYGAYYNFHPDQLGRDYPKMYSGCCSTYQILQNDQMDFDSVYFWSSYRTCLKARKWPRNRENLKKIQKNLKKYFFQNCRKLPLGISMGVCKHSGGRYGPLGVIFDNFEKKYFLRFFLIF